MSPPRPAPQSLRVPVRGDFALHVLEWPALPAIDHSVILLHGFLDAAWSYEDLGGALASRGLHVLAPDQRGHGDSDRIGAGGYYYFMDYVADLAELIRARGRTKISLVGHSMGGSVAAYFAGTFPERVERLVMLEGLGPAEQPMTPQRVSAWIDGLRKQGARSESKRYASVADAAARLRAHDPLLDEELALRLAGHVTRELPSGERVFKHDPLHLTTGPYGFTVELILGFLRAITCPTLIVDGAVSTFRLAPEDAARRRGAIARHTQVTLPDAGHMMLRHQPVQLAQLLGDFLAPSDLP